MIRGKFLTSRDDIHTILDLRHRVFVQEQGYSKENERDEYDDMAVYALVYDENDAPAGTGRLFIDADDHFTLGRICVLKENRGQKLGDLILRMLLYRAQEMKAPMVYLSAQLPVVPFYQRYGFAPYGDIVLDEGVPHRLMRVAAADIDIEGSCQKKKDACDGCRQDCGDCRI